MLVSVYRHHILEDGNINAYGYLFYFCTSIIMKTVRGSDRISVEDRFPAPVQSSPRAHPASNNMGTESFPGLKRPGRDVEQPPHLAPG
jgi:hypothetical protein